MKKILILIVFSFLANMSTRAVVLFQDSTNYPYTNGCIEGQGQWYCYSPRIPKLDALVTNNILILNPTNSDSVATPTNGWVNPSAVNYASFTINVSQLPSTANGGYFCQFQDTNDNNDVCHIFIDTVGTSVPGTYRLGIANFSSSYNSLQPPNNYPLDLVTGITYNVVFLYDNNQGDPLVGATLWINPSFTDYENAVDDPTSPNGFVYGTDTTTFTNLLNINISQIGFSKYVNAGISNVIIGTTFNDVNSTNLPVIGVQPQSATNYSGNSITLYTAASGVDLTYRWFSSTYGALLDDGVNIIGSSSNILVLNNLSATDNYHVVVTDAYGNIATSATATNVVITTPTAPFFPYSGVNLTNNLFVSTGFTNAAEGTGPLFYQWYFAPTNTPFTYTQLVGQTSSSLVIPQLAYANGGSYYVVASNAISGGSITAGPTNSISVIAPLVATIPQLHTLMAAITNQIIANKGGTVFVNSNNVTVSGYVSTFGATSSTSGKSATFFMQNGTSGIQVYYSGTGVTNINVPPPGSYVTVSGPCEVFDCELEIAPTTNIINAIVTNTAVPITIPPPQLGNFNQLNTNPFGMFGITADCSLVTFTNIYIYAESNTAPYGIENITNYNGGIWRSNNYSQIYMTQGPYDPVNNTNIMELYVPAYLNSALTNLWNTSIPTYCYQLTGIWENYKGTAELEVTRYQDLVTNIPSPFTASVALTNGVSTISWSAQRGSTYSVYSAVNLLGPWTQTFGLSYYPSTGNYTVTNAAPIGFYRISTP